MKSLRNADGGVVVSKRVDSELSLNTLNYKSLS